MGRTQIATRDAAVDDVREAIETAWRQALRIDDVHGAGDFFALGGDSLAAMTLISDVQDRLGVAVTLADLLDAPTLDEFAAAVPKLKHGGGRRTKTRRPGAPAPLTRLQVARWRVRRRVAVGGAEVSWLYRIDGPLDVDALCGAVDELIRRHEILRTTFGRKAGRLRQIVQPWRGGYVRMVDMTETSRRDRETAALQRLIDEDYGPAFDYKRGPLIRPTLVKLDKSTHLFSLACSEMVVDGSSRRIIASAITTLYELLHGGRDPGDYPFPGSQFGAFAQARRELIDRSAFMEQLRYWQRTLKGLDPIYQVPGAGLPANGKKVERRTLAFPPSFVERIEATAQQMSTTPFSVMNGAFAALLSSVTGRTDLLYTTTIAHRDVPGAEELIGAFYNNVFLVVDIADAKDGTSLVQSAAAAARESFRRSETPLPQVAGFVPKVKPADGELQAGDVRFQLHEHPGQMRFGGLRTQPVQLPLTGSPDFFIAVTANATKGMDLDLFCRPDLPRPLVEDVLPALRRMVTAIVEDPGVDIDTLLRAGPRGARVKPGRVGR